MPTKKNIRTQLFSLLLVTILAFCVALGVAINGMNNAGKRFGAFLDNDLAQQLAFAEMYAQGLQMGQAIRNIQLDPANSKAYDNRKKAVADFESALAKARQLAAGMPERQAVLDKITALRAKQDAVHAAILQDVAKRELAAATARTNKDETPVWRELKQVILDTQHILGDNTAQTRVEMLDSVKNDERWSAGLALFAILFAVAFSVSIIAGIVTSLRAADEVAGRIAAGDLSSQIVVDRHDEIGELLESMHHMQESLRKTIAEIQGFVEAANRGDFSVKMSLEGKQGYAKTLSELLNLLSGTVDTAFQDTIRVTQALAQGDLSQKVSRDCQGAYQQVKLSVNTTADSLTRIVEEIHDLVDAANRGDFSVKMTLEGKQGYTRTLADLLNRFSDTVDTAFNDTIRVSQALAAGDLTQAITHEYQGTYDELKQSVNATVTNLKTLVGEIKVAVDSISTASREIAMGNADLSQRTEQQASSLEETASSMEELTSTVKQNAANANQANRLAIGASDVAGKGGAVVGQVVGTMSSINESSHKIADIISVIDGIAFQTNILALNAAVEAARAGEQGRGFAVVAAEVRNLAQRSAAAAKEIKTLIGDSVEKVENGTRLVGEAGQTMEEIVASIKRVTDIMAEISAASVEQSSGIELVNQAITQMDEVTQQNAALVEQAAAAAESLEEQAQNLSASVSVFKLTGGLAGMKR